MHVTIYYQGLRRAAYVIDYITRGGEVYIEAIVEGFKVAKQIHASCIKSNVA